MSGQHLSPAMEEGVRELARGFGHAACHPNTLKALSERGLALEVAARLTPAGRIVLDLLEQRDEATESVVRAVELNDKLEQAGLQLQAERDELVRKAYEVAQELAACPPGLTPESVNATVEERLGVKRPEEA